MLRALRRAAPIVRVIATIALLGLLQAVVVKRYGAGNQPVDSYLPDHVYRWGGIVVQESRIYLVAITLVVTFGLWAWTRYTRVGLAINASAQNERAVQTLGWSPDRLAGLTWTIGGVLGGLAAVLAAPLTGLSATTFTVVVTVAGPRRGAARRLPLVPVDACRRPDHRRRRVDGHPLRRRHHAVVPPGPHHRAQPSAGVPRDPARRRGGGPQPALAIARGRTTPEARDPARSTSRGVLVASAITLVLLFTVMNEAWAQATYISLASRDHRPVDRRADRVCGADLARAVGACRHRRAHRGAVRARGCSDRARDRSRHPARRSRSASCSQFRRLRTRGVNLAVITLALGFMVSEVVFANPDYLGASSTAGPESDA